MNGQTPPQIDLNKLNQAMHLQPQTLQHQQQRIVVLLQIIKKMHIHTYTDNSNNESSQSTKSDLNE